MALKWSLESLMARSAPVPIVEGSAWVNLVLTVMLTMSAVALLTWTFAGLLTEIL
jgi:hypothetical protein